MLLINFQKAEYVPNTGLLKMIFSEISFYTDTSQNTVLTHPSLPKQAGRIIVTRNTWSSDSIGQSKISDGRNSVYSTTYSPSHTQLHPTFRCVISNTTFLVAETWYLGRSRAVVHELPLSLRMKHTHLAFGMSLRWESHIGQPHSRSMNLSSTTSW